VATFLDGVGGGRWSWTWSVPPDRLRDAVDRTQDWAASEYGPLDQPVCVETEVRWLAYELRGPTTG
jgi:hypothetical protein